jgi:excisionase family DNA binding protein
MVRQNKEVMLQPLFLSIPEVCESLRLSRAKVYRLIYYEGLPVVHFGRAARVSVVALQEWVQRREQGA